MKCWSVLCQGSHFGGCFQDVGLGWVGNEGVAVSLPFWFLLV